MAKNWWFKLDWDDWLTDGELSACSLETQGFWMRCVCLMNRADVYELTGTIEQLRRKLGVLPEELTRCLHDLKTNNAANVRFGNGDVSIASRRRQKELKDKENNRLYVAKHREKVACKNNVREQSKSKSKSKEKKENPASPDAALSAIHSEKILSGIAEELGVSKLSNTQKRAWLFHTDLAFQNNFSADEFVRCFVALRKKHEYPILPEYVTDRLPDFVKRNKPVEALPTIDQKKADDAINAAALTMPPKPITIGAMQ